MSEDQLRQARMAEAYRRGLLSREQEQAYDEAMRRGLLAQIERNDQASPFAGEIQEFEGLRSELFSGAREKYAFPYDDLSWDQREAVFARARSQADRSRIWSEAQPTMPMPDDREGLLNARAITLRQAYDEALKTNFEKPKKMHSRGFSGALGAADGAAVTMGDEFVGALAGAEALLKGKNPVSAYSRAADIVLRTKGQSVNDNPVTYRLAQVGGSLPQAVGAGGLVSEGIKRTGRHILGPGILNNIALRSGKVGRYLGGAVAPATAGGATDAIAYGTLYEANNRANAEGRRVTGDDRADVAAEFASDPLTYAFGLAVSPLYRAGRFAVTTGNNVRKGDMAWGSFTPTQRAAYAQRITDPVNRAYDKVLKTLEADNLTPAHLRAAMKNYSYAGYNSVEEMIFELAEAATRGEGAGKMKELATALGTVGGDAQSFGRSQSAARADTSLDRIRAAMRRAAGVDGDAESFVKWQKNIQELERTEPIPAYKAAYGKEIADSDWAETLWPRFKASPSTADAVDEALDYALDRGELDVARELRAIKDQLPKDVLDPKAGTKGGVQSGAEGALPPKPSTQALDYIDRMLGDERYAQGAFRPERVRGVAEAQDNLRGVVDPQTGLNMGRDRVRMYKVAQDAATKSQKAAQSGKTLTEVAADFEEAIIEFGDGPITDGILLGWMRGAEEFIEKATNPGTAIRQLYGSERQRAKMQQMMEAVKNAADNSGGAATKRYRGLFGDQNRPSVFDREKRFTRTTNEIFANSQTGQRNAAVESQGGLQRALRGVLDALLDPTAAAKKASDAVVDRIAQPEIFDPKVNRELGKIMFATGADDVGDVITRLQTRADELANKPKPKPEKTNVIADGAAAAGAGDNAVARNAIAAGAGSAGGSVADINQDGEVNWEDALLGAGAGIAVANAPGARKAITDAATSGAPINRRVAGAPTLPEKIKELADEGLTVAEIADEMNTTKNAVQAAASQGRKQGLDIPNLGGREPTKQQYVAELMEKGITKPEAIRQRLNARFPDQAKSSLSSVYAMRSRVKGGAEPVAAGVPSTGPTGTGAIAGGVTGGAAGGDIDANQDGEITWQDQALMAVIGAVGGAAGGHGLKAGLRAGDRARLKDPKISFEPGKVPTFRDWEDAAFGERIEPSKVKASYPMSEMFDLHVHPSKRMRDSVKMRKADREELKERRDLYKAKLPSRAAKRRYQQLLDVEASNKAAKEREELLETGDYEETSFGALYRASEKSDYDLNRVMYRFAMIGKRGGNMLPYEQGYVQLPGLALPIKARRPFNEKTGKQRGWVWLADTPESAARLAGEKSTPSTDVPPPAPGRPSGYVQEVVARRGPEGSVRLRPGMSRGDLEREIAESFDEGSSVVRVTIPQQDVGGVLVPEYTVLVAKRNEVRSPGAKFDTKKSGQEGLMNVFAVGAGAGAAGAVANEKELENVFAD